MAGRLAVEVNRMGSYYAENPDKMRNLEINELLIFRLSMKDSQGTISDKGDKVDVAFYDERKEGFEYTINTEYQQITD